jgi:NADH-quinone oxidoreductase subunit J
VSVETLLFWTFAVATIASAGLVIWAKNPMASAVSLVGTFFFLAGIYVLLWAHTIAVLQVLVYAGAIMVLFLFVIMLLSLPDVGRVTQFSVPGLLGTVATGGLLWTLARALREVPAGPSAWTQDASKVAAFGTLGQLGEALYTGWLLPFEAVSLLLLVAIVGAVVVAKSRI